MANEVWVTWTDGARPTRVVVEDQERPADVDDLCKIFVVDRKWPTLDPASLQVFDIEGDGRTELRSSTKLKDFFVDSSESAPNSGPGQSEETALFIFVGRTQPLDHEKETKLQHMLFQQLALLKLVSEEVNKTRKSRLNCWERESLRTTGSKGDPIFRKNVIRHYKRESNSGKSVKCQILDEYVLHDSARNTIIAAHIWKAETRGKFLDEFGLREEDVNNVRNGMFVTKGIEDAFDNQQVCFLYNNLSRELCLWVADTTIRSDTIVGSNPPKTFAHVHQKPLRCPDEDHMPFRRLLAWHARLTLELRKESIQVINFTSEYDLSPGRAGATLDPIARAIDDMVESGEDASVSD